MWTESATWANTMLWMAFRGEFLPSFQYLRAILQQQIFDVTMLWKCQDRCGSYWPKEIGLVPEQCPIYTQKSL